MTTALRALADADLDPVFAWEGDPRARRMAVFTRENPADRAAFDAHYRRILADPSVLVQAVVHEGQLAGTIGSFSIDGEREVTYWIDPARWGRGIATEALRQLLTLETERPLHARVAATNSASRRVLEKVGFRLVDDPPSTVTWRGVEVTELTLVLQ
ncbi:MAG: GNAT family N-acetyltransferase [Ornithinibacter sp.]